MMNTTGKLKIDNLIIRRYTPIKKINVYEQEIKEQNVTMSRLGIVFKEEYSMEFKRCVLKYCTDKNLRFVERDKKKERHSDGRIFNYNYWFDYLDKSSHPPKKAFNNMQLLICYMENDGYRLEDFKDDTTK